MQQTKDLIARGQECVMNTYGRAPICLVRGEGTKVWDHEGKDYLDFVAGIAVCNLGHAHPQIAKAICDQANTLVHTSNLYWQEPMIALAEKLCNVSGLDKVFYANSGAEANEGALKLARKWGGDRRHIISLKKSFHGRTMGALKATGQEHYQKAFLPLPEGFSYVPANDIDALRTAVREDTCAVLLEVIQGEGGVIAMEEDYLYDVQDLCQKKNLLLMIDEVQTGFGRTGNPFAFQGYDLTPDVVSLAKGIANGLPMGAVLAKEEVAQAFQPGDHASTFGGNPVVARAGQVVCDLIFQEDFLAEVRAKGAYMKTKLQELLTIFPDELVEVRGQGLLLGLVCRREVGPYIDNLRTQGILVGSAGKDVLRFVPPLTVSKEEIDVCITTLAKVVTA